MKALLLGLLLLTNTAQANTFQFLYIEASEGNASGGHVAVQLGEDVYHYQYEDGMVRLFKHHADAFRVNYRLRQNRTLHIADIAVSQTTYDQLNSHFKVQLLSQDQRLKHLQALQDGLSLLQSLLELKTVNAMNSKVNAELAPQLPSAGLFYANNANLGAKKTVAECTTARSSVTVITELRQKLEDRYGKNFLPEKITSLRKKLGKLSPDDKGDWASPHYSFPEHYMDLLNGLLALQVLQKVQPLLGNACFHADVPNMSLNDSALSAVKTIQQRLLLSAQSIAVSNRPDWGAALFITLARLIVIEQTIQSKHWVFLDDVDEKAVPIRKQQLSLYTEYLQKHRQVDLKRLQEAINDLAQRSSNYEPYYTKLEMAANRYHQWLESDKTGEMRYRSEQPLPGKSIPSAGFLLTDLSTTQLEQALHSQKTRIEHSDKDDRKRNGYNLLTKNCVTTLFDLINTALWGQSKRMLGGYLDPKANFIPFQAFDSVKNSYNVTKITEIPAYRKQALSKLYEQEANSLVYLRESNIFSSSLYNHNPDDSWFVFFTDDAILSRPLFGVANTLASTIQTILGLARWPFDGGKEIKKGGRGILASLPELAFFNIRKGSYPYPIEP
ncbi:hypothetical protein MGMO_146c00320 [Methyloglobulus morosus KoM1]|uniref:DUF4105 domain-containing protein n=1 Tax=Methyloglobulus morosus KoM1 TaxID=1116472 RepID=V5BVB7_9GAMM|nr:hypothetical protein [Methyloglobulus morosus]ESS68493.1 hypothetical protein MGMO_146c00320 [Methyloglobulus morosus KoM1]